MVKKKNFFFELDFFFVVIFLTQKINQSDSTKDTKWLILFCVIKIIPKAYFSKFFLEPQKTIVGGKHSFGINLFDTKFVNAIKSRFRQKDQK